MRYPAKAKAGNTATLFAVLNILDGTLTDHRMRAHRRKGISSHFKRRKRDIPARKLIVLRGAGLLWQRTHPKGRSWFLRHPRWILHFNPTSVSSSNAVYALFAKLARRTCSVACFVPSSTSKALSVTTLPITTPARNHSSRAPIPVPS
jgi:hypothetical protein